MDLFSSFGFVNWLAVLAAALATFLIGGVWYSPLLFRRQWIAANNFSPDVHGKRNIGMVFFIGFILQMFSASVLAAVLGPNADMAYGVNAGLLIGLFFVGTSTGITYIFEKKPFKLFAINAGYHAVAFAVMGAILGAWH